MLFLRFTYSKDEMDVLEAEAVEFLDAKLNKLSSTEETFFITYTNQKMNKQEECFCSDLLPVQHLQKVNFCQTNLLVIVSQKNYLAKRLVDANPFRRVDRHQTERDCAPNDRTSN